MRRRMDVQMPAARTKRVGAVKEVRCTYCGQSSEAGRRAMSVFCPHCKKRLILEDYKITSYYAVREFFTCGNVVVEKKGHVVAPVRAGTLTVKGKLQGSVVIRGEVRLTKTGSVTGDIEAASLKIECGAELDGFLRIGVPAKNVVAADRQ